MASLSPLEVNNSYSRTRPDGMAVGKLMRQEMFHNVSHRGMGPLTSQNLKQIQDIFRMHLINMAEINWTDLSSFDFSEEQRLLQLIIEELQKGNAARYVKKIGEDPNLSLHQKRKIIGEICFLAQHAPQSLKKALKADPVLMREAIEDLVYKEYSLMDKQIEQYKNDQSFFNLQDPQISIHNLISRTIARFIFTKKGRLNLGLIETLQQHFLSKYLESEHIEGMILTLSQIDATWQKDIDRITKPILPDGPSSDLIRAELLLSPEEPIKDLHTKWVVISALLNQYGPRSIGDACAVAWEIGKPKLYFNQALSDYTQLIHAGALVRTVEGKSIHFYYKPTLYTPDLYHTFVLTAEGLFNKRPIWECPSIKRGCLQLGINNPAKYKDRMLSILLQGQKMLVIQTTAKEIITAFAQAVKREALLPQALYSFDATSHRLLAACESAFASFSETRGDDWIRDRFDQSIRKTVQPFWEEYKLNKPLTEVTLIRQMQKEFMAALQGRVHYIYNEALVPPFPHPYQITEKGFELYERLVGGWFNWADMGKRIETPEHMQGLLLRVVSVAKQALQEKYPADKQPIQQCADRLEEFLQGYHFMNKCMRSYHQDNQMVTDPSEWYRKLEHTPMTDREGRGDFDIEVVDNSLLFIPPVQKILYKTPYELISYILKFVYSQEDIYHFCERDLGLQELDRIKDSSSSFNLALNNWDFIEFLESEKEPEEWLEGKLIVPGRALADQLIDHEIKKKIGDQFEQQILMDHNEFSASLFRNFVNQISAKEYTLSDYAEILTGIALELTNVPEEELDDMELTYDFLLLKALPPDMLDTIRHGAILFAQLQGSEEEMKIQYCVFYNLRTKKVGIGSIEEDKTDLVPMGETLWIDNQSEDSDTPTYRS